MEISYLLMVGISLLIAIHCICSTVLMLYAWEDKEKHHRNGTPSDFTEPALSFTILLPARHEELVIQDTIQRITELNYPASLVQVLIIIEAGDLGTIRKVNQKLAELQDREITHVRLLTFSDRPINKPHGLNVGLKQASGDIVVIFDAEDEPHPDILQLVNTVMTAEEVPVVQCGVQLMNYADHWFSALNVLEYFFWFKSRLHFHAAIGMIPLGGNTLFIRRPLLEQLHGWDEHCLTEDADLGIRLSTLGVPIRVLYDDRYVTREETPASVSQFIKQRTRWNQGFIQVLFKGDWLRLRNWRQRLLAFYTLSAPLLQTLLLVYLPVSIWTMGWVKMPVLLAMYSSLPLYMLLVQLIINLLGLYEFIAAHKLCHKPLAFVVLRLILGFLPYQLLLGWGALRAVWRHLIGLNNWEKTMHTGAHRRLQPQCSTLTPKTLILSLAEKVEQLEEKEVVHL